MEHFTQDYAELFFGEDAEKFIFQFLEQSLTEIVVIVQYMNMKVGFIAILNNFSGKS